VGRDCTAAIPYSPYSQAKPFTILCALHQYTANTFERRLGNSAFNNTRAVLFDQ
jgi:hypothetical protein